jgi:hypothetical protein
MSARYSLPILIGLTVSGISAAYLLYLLLRKVRVVFTIHFDDDSVVIKTVFLCLLVVRVQCLRILL